ncbi:hydantoinase/carbamoylase family amidase [Bacillus aerolatus]|uniref:Hydantoinase/carbamoylase family amidase n=1 Tax=Bacillus aerolatus TaxID=2653354 RepID=A0A6I1FPA5_9BACI|nr:M20 family metallo-hydrolase [Bacillus aerolatus]KAB7708264.1 hydantoinase/carbamoylase family amidase [Bacillus aerolatus]
MRINLDRLKQLFNEMSKVGATQEGGITRPTLSQQDKEARDLLVSWMKEMQLNVRFDDIGNIYGRREGRNPEAKPIVIGSHLDSIINGGKFDGVLGIICGLEVLETLKENGIIMDRAIEVVNFTNEEGVYFEPLMAGSGLISGDYELSEIYKQQDGEGINFLDELKAIGYLGSEKNRLKEAEAFIEVHIEQGPILDKEKLSIGIVEGIIGFTWLEVTVIGEAENSGPTPMPYRKDALSTSAKMISAIQNSAQEISEYGITTVGKITAEPGVVNTIPGKVTFTVDIRAEELQKQDAGVNLIKNRLKRIAFEEGLEISINEINSMEPIQFHPELINNLIDSADELNYQSKKMISGAGHIASFMNNFCPTAMIFVPSIDGNSHSPKERTDWADIEKATNLLLKSVMKLDKDGINYKCVKAHTNLTYKI